MKCNLLNQMKLKKGCMEETGRQEAKKRNLIHADEQGAEEAVCCLFCADVYRECVYDLRLCGRGSPVCCE